MYSRTRRKNLTSFDYAVRVIFVVLIVGFVLTILLLEPYRDQLIQTNFEIKEEVTKLEEENQVIDTYNRNYLTTLKKD